MLLSAYGDSITAAYGLPSTQGFVPKLAQKLATTSRKNTPFLNYGQNGMTSWDLASAFVHNIDWESGLTEATNICILIGGDDLIHALPLLLSPHFNVQVGEAMRASRAAYYTLLDLALKQKHKGARIAAGTIYNPYPNTEIARTAVDLYNNEIILPVATKFGVSVAAIHAAFAGNEAHLIQGYKSGIAGAPGKDGSKFPIHPNANGQTVIADEFARVLA